MTGTASAQLCFWRDVRCSWCHNPEMQSSAPVLSFDEHKCRNCGRCAALCDRGCRHFNDGKCVYERVRCVGCGKCVTPDCPALLLYGKQMTVGQVMAEAMKDEPLYTASGGGITLSGGEPLYQADFTAALLDAAKERRLNTCVEACGYAPRSSIERIIWTA